MKLFFDDLEIETSSLSKDIRSITIELHDHPLYKSIRTINDVKIYMNYQVWCVWDFMVLLKSLQRALLSNQIEWTPPIDGSIGAYIYEILLTEETDITDSGSGHSSHFETYVKAMRQVGADTGPIDLFISNLKSGKNFNDSINNVGIPKAAFEFVQNTMKHARSEVHKSVSVFCLSREGIIPGMFTTFLNNFSLQNDLSTFRWYLKRHVEVDSDSHGPLSVKLFRTVVGSNQKYLTEALEAALDALKARKHFLDEILKQIIHN